MNDTIRQQLLAPALVLLILTADLTAVRAVPPAPPLFFQDAAAVQRKKLENTMAPVQEQMPKQRALVWRMLEKYDDILSMGPGPQRAELVQEYNRERHVAVAGEVNLDTVLRYLEGVIRKANDFLDTFLDYSYSTEWQHVNNLVKSAEKLATEGRRILRPPPLPDPLPDAARPELDIDSVEYAHDLEVGKVNEFRVRVKCLRAFTPGRGVIEVKLRGGSATIHGDLKRYVVVPAQKTITLTWSFTPTAEGKVKIGARVVP